MVSAYNPSDVFAALVGLPKVALLSMDLHMLPGACCSLSGSKVVPSHAGYSVSPSDDLPNIVPSSMTLPRCQWRAIPSVGLPKVVPLHTASGVSLRACLMILQSRDRGKGCPSGPHTSS